MERSPGQKPFHLAYTRHPPRCLVFVQSTDPPRQTRLTLARLCLAVVSDTRANHYRRALGTPPGNAPCQNGSLNSHTLSVVVARTFGLAQHELAVAVLCSRV